MELFVGISAAVGLTAAAVTEALIQLGLHKDKIDIALWRAGAAIVDFLTESDLLHDHDDDPVMPLECASWASAEMWRRSCIRPEDRRM